MALRVIEYRQLLHILVIFMIVQFTGLLLATQVFTGVTGQQATAAQTVSSSFNALFYIGYIIVLSVVLLLIFKLYKGDKLFLLLEGAVVVIASFIFFLVAIASLTGSAFAALFGSGNMSADVLAIACALGLIIAKYKRPSLRNLTAIIASIGVGLVLGISFSFLAAMIFMVLLAIYDYIAVFVTKHMIALGDMAIAKNLSFLVMVNEVEAFPSSSLSSSQLKEYRIAKRNAPQHVPKGLGKDMVPMSARTALGTGDLAMPLMLSIAAFKVQFSFVLSFVVAIGAIFGLILTLLILRKYRRALPAIPPLLFGILVSLSAYYGIIYLLHP